MCKPAGRLRNFEERLYLTPPYCPLFSRFIYSNEEYLPLQDIDTTSSKKIGWSVELANLKQSEAVEGVSGRFSLHSESRYETHLYYCMQSSLGIR